MCYHISEFIRYAHFALLKEGQMKTVKLDQLDIDFGEIKHNLQTHQMHLKIFNQEAIKNKKMVNNVWNLIHSSFEKTRKKTPIKQYVPESHFKNELNSDRVVKFLTYADKELTGVVIYTNNLKEHCPWLEEKYFKNKHPNDQVYCLSHMGVKEKYFGLGMNNIQIRVSLGWMFKNYPKAIIYGDISKKITSGERWAKKMCKPFKIEKVDEQQYYKIEK